MLSITPLKDRLIRHDETLSVSTSVTTAPMTTTTPYNNHSRGEGHQIDDLMDTTPSSDSAKGNTGKIRKQPLRVPGEYVLIDMNN